MLHIQLALTGVTRVYRAHICTANLKIEFSWIFHLRWYASIYTRIYINYRCKWCYVHFNQSLTPALSLSISLCQSIWASISAHILTLFFCAFAYHSFYLYVYNCLCSCFFSVVLYIKSRYIYIWDEMLRLLPREIEEGE